MDEPVEIPAGESSEPVEVPPEFPGETPVGPPVESSNEPPAPKTAGSRSLLRIGIGVIILAILGAGGFFGYRAYVQGNEDRLVQQAEDALAGGDLPAAGQAASEALALTPAGFLRHTTAAATLLGKALVAQEKYAEALTGLDAALLADPHSATLLALRGRAYLGSGQTSQAMADFKASLALDPSQPALLDLQARLALQTGDLETARTAAVEAGKLDSTLSLPYAFQAEALYAGFNFTETIAAATRSIQLQDPPALAYRLRGGAYYWLYDFAKARLDLEKALELDPKDAESAALLALLAAEKGDKESLKTASDLAAAIDPDSVPALMAQAVSANYIYDHGLARSLIDRAITLAPQRPELYILRTTIYTSTMDEAAMQADIEKALSLAPNLRVARNAQAGWKLFMNELDEAEKIGQQLFNEFPAGEDGYLILNGVYNERFELSQALDIIEKGLAVAGESHHLYNSRATTYLVMGKIDEARSDIEKSLSLVPDSVAPLVSLGYIAFMTGDNSVALQRYQQALVLDPGYVNAFLARARLYEDQEQIDKARADSLQAAALDAQSRYVILDEVRTLYRDNKVSEALKKVDELLARYPRWSDPLILRGWIYLAQNKPSLARTEVENLLQAIPNHPDAHHLLGWIEASEGNYDTALDEVEQILAVQPRNAYAYSLQGNIYNSQGELDKAEASYQKSLEIDPKMYADYVSLGMLHIYQEKNDLAVKELKSALKGGTNPIAETLLKSLESLPEGFKLYFHAGWRFAMAVPEGAEVTPMEDSAAIMYFTFDDGETFYNLWVYWFEGEQGQTSDPWFFSGSFDEAIKQNVPSYTEGELSEFKAMNTTGVKHPYSMTSQFQGQSVTVGGNMYFFSAVGRDMIIECSTIISSEASLDEVFDHIVATFVFLP